MAIQFGGYINESAVTVADILNWLDGWAPFSSAEEWDNVGLLVGCTDTPVTKVLFSLILRLRLSCTVGAELIISHPVIFNPLKSLKAILRHICWHGLA